MEDRNNKKLLYNKINQLRLMNNLTTDIIINNLSFNERVDLLNSKEYICKLFIDKCLANDIKIFTEQDHYKNVITPVYRTSLVKLFDASEKSAVDLYMDSSNSSFLRNIKTKQGFDYLLSKLSDYDLKFFDFYGVYNLPDEVLLQYLSNDKVENNYIVDSLRDDKLKIEHLKDVERYYRISIISSLHDDDLKTQFIKPISKGNARIISSFNSDEKKEKYLTGVYKHLLKYEDIVDILISIKNEEIFKRNMHLLKPSKYNTSFFFRKSVPKDIKLNILENFIKEKDLLDCLVLFKPTEEEKYFNDLIIKKVKKIDYYTLCYTINVIYGWGIDTVKLVSNKIKQRDLKKCVKDTTEWTNFNILLILEDEELILETIRYLVRFPEYNDEYFKIFNIVANKYNLKIEHLVTLAKVFDTSVLKLVENNNIRDLINLNDDKFNKFINIFNKENLTIDKNEQNTILNSIIQRRFRIENANVYNIYNSIIEEIKSGKTDQVLNHMNDIFSKVNINKYNISIDELINGIKEDNEAIKSIFNVITNEYIILLRNKYLQISIEQENKKLMKTTYNKAELIKYLITIFTTDEMVDKIIEDVNIKELNNEEYELYNNKELMRNIISILKSRQKINFSSEMKKVLNVFNKLLSHMNIDLKSCCVSSINEIQVMEPNTASNAYLLNLITLINIEKLKNRILNDKQMYFQLLEFLKKTKFIAWEKRYDEICSEADLEYDVYTVASMINNFDLFKNELGNLTLTNIIDKANLYNSDSGVYLYLFGSEDYKLLRNNPPSSPSPMDKTERLSKAALLLGKMKNRQYITIPPIDKNFELQNKKNINVLVGNTFDTINLTYGERTGACMRIGGAGNTLFELCLLDDNGFHVSFNDPDNGNLVSRVSGFRNGNTVFLNELRYSLSDEYTDTDLQEACVLFAKQLVERTKDSEYPIENVVISSYYAFEDKAKEEKELNVSNIKASFPYFYSDVSGHAIILATASNDSDFVPLKLGKNNSEKYARLRNKPKKYTGKDAGVAAGHIEVLDEYYDGIEYSEINIQKTYEETQNIIFTYAGEDWYVAIDTNGKITSYVMKNSQNPDLATKEMMSTKEIIEKKISNSVGITKKANMMNVVSDISYSLSGISR